MNNNEINTNDNNGENENNDVNENNHAKTNNNNIFYVKTVSNTVDTVKANGNNHKIDKPVYDSSNYLMVNQGDAIYDRYEIIHKIGKGVFGQVYKAFDHKHQIPVALKIIRNEKRFHKQVVYEIKSFNRMTNSRRYYSEHVISLYKWFKFNSNYYLSFELFGINLYNYYKENSIDDTDLRSFTQQITYGLEYIHYHKIIHMDLKPENILIKDKHIKIIDLGSALVEKPYIFKNYVQSRYYRSPEAVFKMPLKTSIDIWSFGCLLYELATGIPLMPAKSQDELIIYFIHIKGYPPVHMREIYDNYSLKNRYLSNGKLLFPDSFEWEYHNTSFKEFVIDCCLCWDSIERYTAIELLKHPFLNSLLVKNAMI